MINDNSAKGSSDLFKILLPQLVVFLTVAFLIYVGSRGHGSFVIFSSFYFLMFYGVVALPIYLATLLVFVIKLVGLDSDFLNTAIGVGVSIYGIFVPAIFCFLSIKLLFLLDKGSVGKQRLKKIFNFHLLIGLLLVVLTNASSFELVKFLERGNLIFQFGIVFITSIFMFVMWGTLFEIVDRKAVGSK
jgi:hypothetical protein